MTERHDVELAFACGPGGWLQAIVNYGNNETTHVFVHFVRKHDHWGPAAMWIANPTVAGVRAIPLHRIEIALAGSDTLSERLARDLEADVPPVGSPDFYKAFEGYLVPEKRFRLERPSRKHLGDGFFRDVARAYRSAAAAGLKPRQVIAGDTGSSPDTVARWVGEARRRGHLSKARPGKVTP
jgi:hypothetical protein